MGAMQAHLLGAVEYVAQSKRNPRKIRDGKRSCPRCWSPMQYKRVTGAMLEWSPCDHAWFCDSCPPVRVIDGSIDPSEDTWQSREKAQNHRQLNSYLMSLLNVRSDDQDGEDDDA
jgi:hypothetical protein